MKTTIIVLLITASTNVFCQCALSASVSPSTNSTSCNGSITAISNGVSCPPYTATVIPGNSFTNLCPGTYTIIITDQGGSGCCGTISGTVSIPNSAGINEITNNSIIKIYPNPVYNILYLSAEQNEFKNTEIEITNTLGQIILKTTFSNEIDVSKLANGFYNLKIITNSRQIYLSKFIKD